MLVPRLYYSCHSHQFAVCYHERLFQLNTRNVLEWLFHVRLKWTASIQIPRTVLNNKALFTDTTVSIAISRNRYCSHAVNASNTSYRFVLLIYKCHGTRRGEWSRFPDRDDDGDDDDDDDTGFLIALQSRNYCFLQASKRDHFLFLLFAASRRTTRENRGATWGNLEREARCRGCWRKLYLNKTDINLDIAVRVYVFRYNTSYFAFNDRA